MTVRTLLLVPLVATLLHGTPLIAASDCDWIVSGESIEEQEDRSGVATLDALLTKLAQFDECLGTTNANEQLDQQNAASAAAASAAKKAQQASVTQGSQATGPAANVQGPEAKDASAPRQDGDELNSPSQQSQGRLGTPHTVDGVEGKSQAGTAKNELKEDNLARMLREAAEKETDPARKKELWANYNDYMDAL